MKEIKDRVAVQSGYPDWETMENYFIDTNESQPVNIAVLMNSAWQEVAELFAQEFGKYLKIKYFSFQLCMTWVENKGEPEPGKSLEFKTTEQVFEEFKQIKL